MNRVFTFFLGISMLIISLFPMIASAHEVYVLDHQNIQAATTTPSPNPLSLIRSDNYQFMTAALIGIILVGVIFLISISRGFETLLDPWLLKIKKWAPLVARITLGLSLLASSYYGALFGPELPLGDWGSPWSIILRVAIGILGACILLGLFVRESALVALVIFIGSVILYKTYMFTYVNYLGEIVVNLILGAGAWSLDRAFNRTSISRLAQKLEPYAFPILRALFGFSAIYASWYAKLLHSQLAIDTVTQYQLTNYFPFAPLFVVLGALIIETLIGIFFIIGFEIRFTSLLFLGFLTASLLFFGEVVWPHLILIGVNLAFLLHGYDRFSIEGRFIKKTGREPVL